MFIIGLGTTYSKVPIIASLLNFLLTFNLKLRTMKKFLFILIASIAMISAAAANVKTIYVDMPTRVLVVKDSTFSVRVRGVDSKYVEKYVKNDTIYFRTKNSDLKDTRIFITSPSIDDVKIIASRGYEVKECD